MKEVLLVKPRGFCAGVVRAIAAVESNLATGPLFVKHQLVHNQVVCDDLALQGAIFVESVEEVPEGKVVVFSAHGSPPEDYVRARERGLRVVDATCPLVTRVHNEARKFAREGRTIFLIGHQGHVEVTATLGQAEATGADVHLVDPGDPVWDHQVEPDDPGVAVLTQTTLSLDDVAPAVAKIQQSFPDAVVRTDICYATTNRQEAVRYLATRVGAIVVIGSSESSNTRRLVEVARREGCPAVLVATAKDLPFSHYWPQRIGVASGASTPEFLVQEVVAMLEGEGYTRQEVEVVPEDVSFKPLEGGADGKTSG